jgi:hypothetical protein
MMHVGFSMGVRLEEWMDLGSLRGVAATIGRGLGCAGLALTLCACGGSGPAGSAGSAVTPDSVPFPPTPESDDFYAQPATLAGLAPGTILKSRSVTFAPVGGRTEPNEAWQLQFVSRDVNGAPIAAVATVVKPTVAATGVAPLLAFQYAEDALGNQCAPSHTVTGSTADANSQAESAEPLPGLALGWTVVYPDHEGPYGAYGAGRLAGQITLDSVRAALAFAPLDLSATTPVGLWGYSGGAIATAWAASLQQEYAPELDIVAVASGGTPADGLQIAQNVDTNPVTNAAFFSLILSAVEGVNRAYPALVTPYLNDKGRAAFESLKDGCIGSTSDGSAKPSGHFADYTSVPDPFNTPGVVALRPLITLPLAGHAPTADLFVYHSMVDELIPIAGTDAMVAAWCQAGSTVHYYRGVSGDHVAFAATLSAGALAYLEGRFEAAPATVVPPTTQSCN